jgi:GNAT superfamily N-acetyltransferase
MARGTFVAVTVRDATIDDLDDICALITELAAYERLADEVTFEREVVASHLFGPLPVARVTIADADQPFEPTRHPGAAGFALWYPTFSTFLGRPGIWLEDLYIRPEYRGQGLGRELLDHLRGLTDGRLEWAVLDWNEPAIAFYRQLGAEPVAGWTRYCWLPGVRRPPGPPDVDVSRHQ